MWFSLIPIHVWTFISVPVWATTLWGHGFGAIQGVADAAQAMKPLSGGFALILFGCGLFNVSRFAASILPLSTAYSVCEGLDVESGVDKSCPEAPIFYSLDTLLIAGGARYRAGSA